MKSSTLRVMLFLTLAAVQSTASDAQGTPEARQQAVTRALLFVRGSASEELRTVPAADITVDASTLPNVSTSPSNPDLVTLGGQLRMHVVSALDAKCVQAGIGLTKLRAQLARAECVTASSRYYMEAEQLQVGEDTAIVMVHVFRRHTHPDRPHASRIDYAGYKVELLRQANEWGKPRLISRTDS